MTDVEITGLDGDALDVRSTGSRSTTAIRRSTRTSARRSTASSSPAPGPSSPAGGPTSRTITCTRSSTYTTSEMSNGMSYQVALNFEDAVTQIIGCRPDETAAEASHKARINVPPDCRDGSCGTCKSMCKSGRYDGGDHIYEALTEGEAALGYCLPCRTTPQGDLILRIPVITGSARGIGLVVARRLVAESAEVTLVDRSHLVGRCRPRWNATVGLTSWRTRSPHRPPSNTPRPVSVRRQRAGQNRRPAPADALPLPPPNGRRPGSRRTSSTPCRRP